MCTLPFLAFLFIIASPEASFVTALSSSASSQTQLELALAARRLSSNFLLSFLQWVCSLIYLILGVIAR
jgi:hypothetical protein